MIKLLSMHGMVHISSERELPESLEKYRLKIDSSDIIHVIASADLFISDSQTMSAEAGYFGTPYIRYNDFVGLISYLDVLENKYNLGYGIKTTEYEKLIITVKELLNNENLKAENKLRRQSMLDDTEDLTELMIKLFTGFPQSLEFLRIEKKWLNMCGIFSVIAKSNSYLQNF
ncbi:MAG: hypothetical protein IPJ75_16185 [Ignavibacteriales bacterium]|nr:hypothetical protein [Ignavibacteriales bacterium]